MDDGLELQGTRERAGTACRHVFFERNVVGMWWGQQHRRCTSSNK